MKAGIVGCDDDDDDDGSLGATPKKRHERLKEQTFSERTNKER